MMLRVAGLSPSRLARDLEISRSTVHRWMVCGPPGWVNDYVEALAVFGPLRLNPFAAELETLRTRLRLTQQDMAHRCGVPTRTYRRWMKGTSTPSPARLALVAVGLGIHPHTLMPFRPCDRGGNSMSRRGGFGREHVHLD
jgi:DNA-binding transcriptional regulator YiaG